MDVVRKALYIAAGVTAGAVLMGLAVVVTLTVAWTAGASAGVFVGAMRQFGGF
jgi:hypothetical protein